MSDLAQALVYTCPGVAEIHDVTLPSMAPGMVEVRTRHTALSRGTERLVFQGAVPEAEWGRMRAPMQSGDFPFPVRYGYMATGVVTAGPDALIGRDVFCLHPHQTRFRVAAEAVVPVPDAVPSARAVLGANMETALNAVWDAAPRPGARCLIVGAGLVGTLIAFVLTQWKSISVHVTDKCDRAVVTWSDMDVNFVSPLDVPGQAFDIAFHTSATAGGLQTAIDALDFEGRVIELSWYGDRPVSVGLGGNFHANRLQIVSSQVGQIAPARRGALGYRERLQRALAALADPAIDALMTEEVAFHDLPARLPDLLAPDAPGIATRIVYPMHGEV